MGYRLGKFVRRHRGIVAAAAVALTAVVGGAGVAAWQAAEARRALSVAETKSETASEVAALLASILEQADPTRSRGAEVTVREALALGADRIRADLADRPLVASELLRTIGATYLNLGLPNDGLPLLQEALALVESVRDAPPFDIALTQDRLAAAYLMLGRVPQAEPFLRGSIAYWDAQPLGEHRFAYGAYNNLGAILLARGDIDGALVALGEGVRHARATEGAEGALAGMAHNLSALHLNAGRYDLADSLSQIALPLAANALGRDHPLYNPVLGGVAEGRLMTGHVDQADGMFEELEADLRERFPDQTSRRARAVVGQGNAALMRGDLADADRHYAAALRLFEIEMPRQSAEIADVLVDQADIRLRTGRAGDALALAREAARTFDAVGPDRWEHARAQSVLGAALAATGQRAEGARRMTAGRDTLAARRGPDEHHARLAARRLTDHGG